MLELKQTETFRRWRRRLRDERARALIAARLDRLAYGHAGDAEPVGQGVSELRIHYGPGYRIYFQRRGMRSSFCSAEGIRVPRPRTSGPPNGWPRNGAN